jgi:hypothetical protein
MLSSPIRMTNPAGSLDHLIGDDEQGIGYVDAFRHVFESVRPGESLTLRIPWSVKLASKM